MPDLSKHIKKSDHKDKPEEYVLKKSKNANEISKKKKFIQRVVRTYKRKNECSKILTESLTNELENKSFHSKPFYKQAKDKPKPKLSNHRIYKNDTKKIVFKYNLKESDKFKRLKEPQKNINLKTEICLNSQEIGIRPSHSSCYNLLNDCNINIYDTKLAKDVLHYKTREIMFNAHDLISDNIYDIRLPIKQDLQLMSSEQSINSFIDDNIDNQNQIFSKSNVSKLVIEKFNYKDRPEEDIGILNKSKRKNKITNKKNCTPRLFRNNKKEKDCHIWSGSFVNELLEISSYNKYICKQAIDNPKPSCSNNGLCKSGTKNYVFNINMNKSNIFERLKDPKKHSLLKTKKNVSEMCLNLQEIESQPTSKHLLKDCKTNISNSKLKKEHLQNETTEMMFDMDDVIGVSNNIIYDKDLQLMNSGQLIDSYIAHNYIDDKNFDLNHINDVATMTDPIHLLKDYENRDLKYFNDAATMTAPIHLFNETWNIKCQTDVLELFDMECQTGALETHSTEIQTCALDTLNIESNMVCQVENILTDDSLFTQEITDSQLALVNETAFQGIEVIDSMIENYFNIISMIKEFYTKDIA